VSSELTRQITEWFGELEDDRTLDQINGWSSVKFGGLKAIWRVAEWIGDIIKDYRLRCELKGQRLSTILNSKPLLILNFSTLALSEFHFRS